jgi:hypothetical protein
MMPLVNLLKTLGYGDSPNFLCKGGRDRDVESAPAFGHIFRLAAEKRGLVGVYTLRDPSQRSDVPPVPVLYLCEAPNDEEADKTHRLVWNQDVVPFLVVSTPDSVRLYSGFEYRRRGSGPAEGLLRVLKNASDLIQFTDDFHADSIDDGNIWRTWGSKVNPENRVDWQLLENLRRLDRWLQKAGLKRTISHALIGKYVYLRYLRDRDILSDRKLQSWGLASSQIFGRDATIAAVRELNKQLDEWLNGGVFPLDLDGPEAPTEDQLRHVAATFNGDQPLNDGTWQLHLDFRAYDFSYIPIETLSVVYEQFLHDSGPTGDVSRGRDAGAYYTPIPVVNFMIAEIEAHRPLAEGMRVFDPSCGSGAFLVQCYRRLIEKAYPPQRRQRPGPVDLRDLLERHIFGVDRDPDACSVTELSLILTLLDYVEPPDLENGRRVKLPSLRGKNIFCENFFDPQADALRGLARRKFDWIVGNPPWKHLNPRSVTPDDKPVWDWIAGRVERGTPVGGNQIAQAFAWEVRRYLAGDGEAALLLPAMILFEDPSEEFRTSFLCSFRVHSVANFANLAEVLFAGRSRVPAAALFYALRPKGEAANPDESIATYSPLVANQEPTRPVSEGSRNETWSIVVNAAEVRDIPLGDVMRGERLPWKLALWGSDLDRRLVARTCKQFTSFSQLERSGRILASQGLELRTAKDDEDVDPVAEVAGANELDVKKLEQLRHLFVLPRSAIKPVAPELTHVRRGRGDLPLSICKPPHVIVSAARNFAIYSEEFLIVPPRQIGIVSPTGEAGLLKALSLYLSSEFVYYHQFLTSPQFGVQRAVATLGALREIPVPVNALLNTGLDQWTDLHARLVRASESALASPDGSTLFSPPNTGGQSVEQLLKELNNLVAESLQMTDRERALVDDLVTVRLALNDGKTGKPAVSTPKVADMRRYAKRLKAELDDFTGDEVRKSHDVDVVYGEHTAMVRIGLLRASERRDADVVRADSDTAVQLERARQRLRKKWAQWVYFDRNLRIYEGNRLYILKPMQRFHWTESQAMADAREIIAEKLEGAGAT